ncbi:hypothetical protein O988_00953 [Pseudogymnoascus sp. VKM F-3808]|nr:hypothetical protein O988_00953 [Pseudogymnoascus sp. VKM F-3808]
MLECCEIHVVRKKEVSRAALSSPTSFDSVSRKADILRSYWTKRTKALITFGGDPQGSPGLVTPKSGT